MEELFTTSPNGFEGVFPAESGEPVAVQEQPPHNHEDLFFQPNECPACEALVKTPPDVVPTPTEREYTAF